MFSSVVAVISSGVMVVFVSNYDCSHASPVVYVALLR